MSYLFLAGWLCIMSPADRMIACTPDGVRYRGVIELADEPSPCLFAVQIHLNGRATGRVCGSRLKPRLTRLGLSSRAPAR